ncbi:MAG: hypothetical protein V4621_02025 [Pseudomonadota bacterium]
MSRPVTFARPVLDLTRKGELQGHARPGGAVSLRALLDPDAALNAGQEGLARWLDSGQDVFPVFKPLLESLATQDWHIDFHDLDSQACIDAVNHTLYLPHFGYSLPKLIQHGLFGVLVRIELYRGLRLAWQAMNGLTPLGLGLGPQAWLKWARVSGADADIYMLLLAYALRDEGPDSQIWRYALAGSLYPVAATLSHVLSVGMGRAAALGSMQKALHCWLQQSDLVTTSDRAALDDIDQAAEETTLPDGDMTPADLVRMGHLTGSLNYMDAIAVDLSGNQPFWTIPDPVAQTHLAQILEEQNYIAIGPIVMRDAELARKLFS